MADVNANINIGINTSAAVGSLRALQTQISQFNQSLAASNAAAAASQRQLTSNLAAQVAATRAFSTSFQKIESNASRLQTAIDKNRLSLGEYFRYGVASSGAFGRVFRKEHNEVMDLAADRVKRLQTQYLALGRAQNGFVDTMAVRPLQLHNADAAISIQRQQLFNKLLRDGGTSMVNWGKNTQWAGRQLMVGFTVPLTIFGGYAASVFMDLDKQITQFKRVYGDAMTPTAEADAMVRQIQDLAKEYTKYGITVSDSIQMAANAAATGLQQEDLLAATEQALRLATLGQIEYQQALDATISLQSAFDISSAELAETIDFLNATENQTIVSLDDITQAIPRVAPVIKGLGGDVKDLAAFLAAMREGGVNAAEGANALKSGLASLINPSKQANELLKEMGINIDSIVKKNEGDLMGTVQDFALAIKDLSNLDRQKALATLFGKYQFARMGALFKNIIRDGSQAQRVIDLAGLSVKELADLSEKDLGRLEESIGTQFLGAFERFKLAIAPLGEEFLKIATPILNWVTQIIERFNEASPEIKKWALIIIGALGGVLPVFVMVAGLFGNFLGSMIKGAGILKSFFGRLIRGGRSIGYMEGEMLDAVAASNSLEGATNGVTQALNVQKEAVEALARAYQMYMQGAREALTGVAGVAATTNIPASVTRATQQAAPQTGTPTAYGPSGYAAWGGSKQVNVKGSFESAHLSAMGRELSLQELTEIYHRPGTANAIKKQIEEAIVTGEDGQARLEKAVMGYTNEVVQLPRTVHRELTDKGQTSLAKVRTSLIKNADFAHSQLAMSMRELGATDKQITTAMKFLTKEISSSLSSIEQQSGKSAREIMITSEQFDQIVRAAYQKLAASRAQFRREAVAAMQEIETISFNRGTSRAAISRASYKANRGALFAEMEQTASRIGTPVPFTEQGAIKLESRLQKLNISLEQAAALWNQLSRSAQRSLLSMSDNAELFTTSFVAEARQAGLLAGTALEEALDAGFNGVAVGAAQGAEVSAGMRTTGLVDAKGRPISSEPRQPQSQRVQPTGFYSDISSRQTYAPDGTVIKNFEDDVKRSGASVAEETAKSNGIIKRGASAFGRSLVQGSGKLQGGLFALDGLVFGLSFLDNQIGEFAGKIMPAIFAFQGLSMLLPALMNPVGAAIAAIAAVAGAALFLKLKMNEMSAAAQDAANALVANSEVVKNVGEFYGNEPITATARTQGLAEAAEVSSETIKQAQEFLASDVGKQITNGLSTAMAEFGQTRSAEQFASSLATMMLQGAINFKQAKAMATVLGEQLGSKAFGIQVIGELKSLVGPTGKKIENDPFKVAVEINVENREFLSQIESLIPDANAIVDRQFNGPLAARLGESLAGGMFGTRFEEFLNQQAVDPQSGTREFVSGLIDNLPVIKDMPQQVQDSLESSIVDRLPGALRAGVTIGLSAIPGVGALGPLAMAGIDLATQGMADWDNQAGAFARTIQGALNPAVAEANQLALNYGSIAGNIVAQSYENLFAAQQRTLGIQERLNKAKEEEAENSTKATRAAVAAAEADYRRAKSQEQMMIDSINRSREQIENAFALAGGSLQQQMMTGIDESLASMYEAMGEMGKIEQAALGSLSGIFGEGSQEAQYRLKLEILSGNLTASQLTGLTAALGGSDAVANLLVNVTSTMGGNTAAAADFMTSILAAGDQDLVRNVSLVATTKFNESEMLSFTSFMEKVAGIPDEDLRRVFIVDAMGMTASEMDEFSESAYKFSGLPPRMQKLAIMEYSEEGPQGLNSAIEAIEVYDELPDKITKKVAIEMAEDLDLDLTQKQIDAFVRANEETQIKILMNWLAPEEDPQDLIDGAYDSHIDVPVNTKKGDQQVSEKELKEGIPEEVQVKVGLKKPTPEETKYLMEGAGMPTEPITVESTISVLTGKADQQLAAWITTVEGMTPPQIPVDADTTTALTTAETARAAIDAMKASIYVDLEGPGADEAKKTGGFTGGMVGPKGFNAGGQAVPGDGGRDTVLAMLAPGEFVMRKRAVDQYGESFFRSLNMGAFMKGGRIKKFAAGGTTGNARGENFGWVAPPKTGDGENAAEALKDRIKEIKDALENFTRSLYESTLIYTNINTTLKSVAKGTKSLADQILRFGNSLITSLRATGMSETAVQQIISMGAEEAKAWFQKYTNKKGQLTKEGKQQVVGMNAAFVGEQMSGYVGRARTAAAQRRVMTTKRDIPDNVRQEIANDPESAQAYTVLLENARKAQEKLNKAKPGSKAWKQANAELKKANGAIKSYEEKVKNAITAEEDLAKALDPVAWGIEQIDKAREATLNQNALTEAKFAQAFGEMERAAAPGIKASQERIKGLEKQIDAVQDEIDAIEELNEADQQVIRTLERQKELIGRQIEELEYANELDQRKIEAFNRQKELIGRQIADIERANELDQRKIDALDRQKEMLGRQLEIVERANELDQRRVEALDRQKEMINRQMQAVEELNEKDQQKISDLQREDEMRNRISESLNRDLELMSRREQDIQASYDKRIQSLEKVSKINDHIINQQKSQLGIARALSQGDIYAATEAMEQRRQQQLEFSREQTRAALETGKQNAIGSLRTAGGLTRQQAEQQIQQIGDQNYQNSLAIRDIEDGIHERNKELLPLKEQVKNIDAQILTIQDAIYDRNLAMVPVRDQMYQIDQEILGIQDKIYERNLATIPLRDQIYDIDKKIELVEDGIYDRNLKIVPLKDEIRKIDKDIQPIADAIWGRETDILKIQNERLKPLQDALDLEQDRLDSQEEDLENAKASLIIDGVTYEQLQNQIAAEEEAYNLAVAQIRVNNNNVKSIEKIVDAWKKVGVAIAAANRTAQDMSRQAQQFADNQIAAVEASEMEVKDKQAKIAEIISNLQNKLNQIESDRKAAIERARQDATRQQRRQGNYAGGMIKRYAAGSLVPGDGSRDSVLAELTPGEYVVRKAMVKKYGEAMLNDINTGSFSIPKYKVASYGSGNLDSGKAKTEINAPVYNTYSVQVNVPNANVNADEVANKVMHRIRSMNSGSVRNYRGF